MDLKKIVIGLMDRLSAYAARETETSVDPEQRKQTEEEAVTKLLENLKVAEEAKKEAATAETEANAVKENGVEQDSKEPEQSAEGMKGEPAAQENGDKNGEAEGEEEKPGVPADAKLYSIFYDQVVNLIKTRGLPIQDTMALLVSLVNLALNTYPDHLEYVDQILEFATKETAEYADHADLHSTPTQQNLLYLLLAPTRSYVSIFTALALPHYLPLLTSQSYPTRRSVAGEIARSLLKNRTLITTTENLERVLHALRVLIKEGAQQSMGYPGLQSQRRGETDETIEEQGWLARLVHLIQAPENDTQLKVISLQTQSSLALLLTHISSFFKPLAKRMRMATSASDTPLQLS